MAEMVSVDVFHQTTHVFVLVGASKFVLWSLRLTQAEMAASPTLLLG